MVDVDSLAMQSRGLSARDVNAALVNQVITAPLGDARIGQYDYRVNMNNTPVEPASFNDIPVGTEDNKIIFLRDVGFAHDGFAPQTNIVAPKRCALGHVIGVKKRCSLYTGYCESSVELVADNSRCCPKRYEHRSDF